VPRWSAPHPENALGHEVAGVRVVATATPVGQTSTAFFRFPWGETMFANIAKYFHG
jgi:hypothetical protein